MVECSRQLLAVQAALVDLRIPQVQISPTDDPTEAPEIELDDDPEHSTALDTSRVPLVVSLSTALVRPHLPLLTHSLVLQH